VSRRLNAAEAKYARQLGRWILQQRQTLAMTGRQFAQILGVHRNTLLRWEQGGAMPNPYQLLRIQRIEKDAAVTE